MAARRAHLNFTAFIFVWDSFLLKVAHWPCRGEPVLKIVRGGRHLLIFFLKCRNRGSELPSTLIENETTEVEGNRQMPYEHQTALLMSSLKKGR